jgi:hypothetical protein
VISDNGDEPSNPLFREAEAIDRFPWGSCGFCFCQVRGSQEDIGGEPPTTVT